MYDVSHWRLETQSQKFACQMQWAVKAHERCVLRKTRPPTRVFGPFGPEVPPEVPERVSPKSGMCLGVFEGVLQQKVSKSDLKVSKKTLFGHILGGPQGHFPRYFRAHPEFWRHSLGHSQGHFGPEGPEDSCRGLASSQGACLPCLRSSHDVEGCHSLGAVSTGAA